MKRWRKDAAEGHVVVTTATLAWAREALAEHVNRLVTEPGRCEDRDEWMETYNTLATTANDLGTTIHAVVSNRLGPYLDDETVARFDAIRNGAWPVRRS